MMASSGECESQTRLTGTSDQGMMRSEHASCL
jgi:hypothetical protein